MGTNYKSRINRLEQNNGHGRGWVMKLYKQEKDGSRTYKTKWIAQPPDWYWVSVGMDYIAPDGFTPMECTDDFFRVC